MLFGWQMNSQHNFPLSPCLPPVNVYFKVEMLDKSKYFICPYCTQGMNKMVSYLLWDKTSYLQAGDLQAGSTVKWKNGERILLLCRYSEWSCRMSIYRCLESIFKIWAQKQITFWKWGPGGAGLQCNRECKALSPLCWPRCPTLTLKFSLKAELSWLKAFYTLVFTWYRCPFFLQS